MADEDKNSRTRRMPPCDIVLLVDAEAGVRKSHGDFVHHRSSVEAYLLAGKSPTG